MTKKKPFWELNLNPITMTRYVSAERELAIEEYKKERKRKNLSKWNPLSEN